MDYTQIISAVIALISALVSAFLIPWLKTKIDADKLQTLRTYVEIGVKAAEQLYAATDGAAKKAYVVNFLAEKGIQFDVETIDKLIEAAVLQLHHELYGRGQSWRNRRTQPAARQPERPGAEYLQLVQWPLARRPALQEPQKGRAGRADVRGGN